MKIMRFHFLLAVFATCIPNLYAQQTSPYFLTQSRPGEAVHETANWHLLQDREGNIWILTQSGISKYNGSFFTSPSLLTDELSEYSYTKAYQGQNNRVWFVGIGGKLAYYENNKFHAYQHGREIEKFLSNDKCVSFHEDSSRIIHIGTLRHGYFKILPDGEIQNPVNRSDSSGIYFTRIEGNHFLFGIRSLDKYNPKLPIFSFRNTGNYSEIAKLYDDTIASKKEHFPRIRFASFTNGDLVISKNQRLAIVRSDNSVEIKKLPACMTGLTIDSSDGVWLSGVKTKGVYYYPNGDFRPENEQHFRANDLVHHVIEDHQKGIWLGTDKSGLLHMPFRRISELNTIKVESWKAIDKPNLIKEAKAILSGKGMPGLFRVYDGENIHELSVNTEKSISTRYFDRQENTLFLGSQMALIMLKVNGTGKAKKQKIELDKWVRSIIPKRNGNGLWIAAGEVVHGVFEDRIISSLPPLPYDILRLCESDSFLYAATTNGLWKFDGEQWLDLSSKSERNTGLISHLAWHNNRLWIFSYRHGLTAYFDGIFQPVRGDKNYEFNQIHCSNTTDTSIQFVTANGQFVSVAPSNDVGYDIALIPTPHLFIPYSVTSICDVGSHLLFESRNNVFLYSKESKYPLPNISMAIDSIVVNGVSKSFSDELILPHDSNTIRFHFSVKSYHSKNLNAYVHRMSGIDKWTYTKQHSQRYNTLPKGQHTFEIYAANDFFQHSRSHAVTITILPPYYETWWFRTAIGTLIGLLIFAGVKLRIQRIKKKGALLEELHGSQYQALAARMNPHFLFNSLSAIHEFTLQNSKEVSAEYINDYALLMRMVLENSVQNVVSLKTELETISLYLKMENLRCQGKIHYSVEINNDVDVNRTEIPTALLQPYIENAVWHGLAPKTNGRAELTLKIERDAMSLVLSIEDNGIGRKASSQLGTSNHIGFESQGTDITEKRIQLMNSLYGSRIAIETIDLVENDGEPSGTLVKIRIPE